MNENENPPTEEPITEKNSFGWPFWLFLAVFISIVAGLTAPMTFSRRKKSEQTEAINNVRQIGFALLEFDSDYGSYPNDETAKEIADSFPNNGLNLSGKSSNALFRQLFAAGLTQSEAMFYAQINGTRKPDGDISGGKALEKGEVGFGYIAGLSSAGNPARPILFCPIIPGTDRFDPKPLDGNAVILRCDNSVASLKIDENGHATLEGTNILSPEHPVWGDVVPDIRYPDL